MDILSYRFSTKVRFLEIIAVLSVFCELTYSRPWLSSFESLQSYFDERKKSPKIRKTICCHRLLTMARLCF